MIRVFIFILRIEATTYGSTNTNQLQVNIPDELVGINLQIIILPSHQRNKWECVIFTESKLQLHSIVRMDSFINESDGNRKWEGNISAHIYFANGSDFTIRLTMLPRANSFDNLLCLPLTNNKDTKGVLIDNSNLDGYSLPKMSIQIYKKIGVIA